MKKFIAGFLLLSVGLMVSGCGSSTRPVATVTGTVSYKGKPVTGGTITFFNEDDTYNGSSRIFGDGSYSVPDAPVGSTKVVVLAIADPNVKLNNSGTGGGGMGANYGKGGTGPPPGAAGPASYVPKGTPMGSKSENDPPEPKFMKLPAKYGKTETSDLKFNVENGKNSYNPDLKD